MLLKLISTGDNKTRLIGQTCWKFSMSLVTQPYRST